jgi:hypothetical protein
LTAQWVREPTIIEADCSTMIDALRSDKGDKGPWVGVLKEIRALCELILEFSLMVVKRERSEYGGSLTSTTSYAWERVCSLRD